MSRCLLLISLRRCRIFSLVYRGFDGCGSSSESSVSEVKSPHDCCGSRPERDGGVRGGMPANVKHPGSKETWLPDFDGLVPRTPSPVLGGDTSASALGRRTALLARTDTRRRSGPAVADRRGGTGALGRLSRDVFTFLSGTLADVADPVEFALPSRSGLSRELPAGAW